MGQSGDKVSELFFIYYNKSLFIKFQIFGVIFPTVPIFNQQNILQKCRDSTLFKPILLLENLYCRKNVHTHSERKKLHFKSF